MLIDSLAKEIQDNLHDIASSLGYDINFLITANIQRYDEMMTIEGGINDNGKSYNAGILYMVGSPITFNTLDIKVTNYRLEFWGLSDERENIEKIIELYHSQKPMYNNHQIYASKLFIDGFGKSTNGLNETRFNGYITVEDNELPYTANGLTSPIMFDDVSIPFNTIRFRKDKSLIPNVSFGGTNTDVKLISESVQIELPIIIDNTKISELLADVLDDTYNKKYTLKWEIGNVIKTADMVLRVGTIEYNSNNQPITFWITLERTLPRKEFKVDGITIPLLKWSFGSNVEITSKSKSSGIESTPVGSGRVVSALFLNDGSAKVTELIANLENHGVGKRFNIVFEVNQVLFNYRMIIKEGSIQVTEHPDLVIECTFIEGS